MSNSQHGFRKQRSTVTQLLSFLDEVYHTSDFTVPSAAVYSDFSKTFDSVRHDIILNKLSIYGFDHDFLLLFLSYLCNQSQCVRINAHISNPRPVTSGVPHGSIFGPLLFLLFINGLPECIEFSSCYLFADDSKLVSTDFTSLQHDIDYFTNWCTANDLSVNHDKCSLIVFKGNFPRHVMVNDQDITASNVVKELGLLVSDDLNWMIHINKLLSCNKSLHFIRRNFPFTFSQSTKLMFGNMCIKSIIFNASPVWFPSLCYIRKLDSFNRKCLKWVIGSLP